MNALVRDDTESIECAFLVAILIVETYIKRGDFRVAGQGREKNLHNRDATVTSQAYHILSC